MKFDFRVLKQKMQRQRLSEAETSHSMLQNMHDRFFHRMHDLDYLQWLQRNGIRYMGCICLLTMLFSASVYVVQGSASELAIMSAVQSGNETAEIPSAALDVETGIADAKQQIAGAVADNKEKNSANADTGLTDPVHSEKKQVPEYRNPLHLPGYQAPVNGMLQYNYGLGYDAVYNDYRFHKEICYDMGNGDVLACVDGVIGDIQMNQHWQLALQIENGIVWYRGLQSCDVAAGDAVTVGQKIGTADSNVYIQAMKNNET